MGEVYKARDTRLNRMVAVKFLKGPHTERFEREGRAIAAFNIGHAANHVDGWSFQNSDGIRDPWRRWRTSTRRLSS
jgi:serine/threonine protein kinase